MALLSVFNQLVRRDLRRVGVASETVDVAGARLHFYDAPGSHDLAPTLLVHGFGDSANTWYQMLVPLARALGRVVAVDYPGVGFSGLPPGKEFETVPELIDTLEAFARTVFDRPSLLVGHSLGGALALRMAARQSALLASATGGGAGGPGGAGALWQAVLAISPAGAQVSPEQWAHLRQSFELTDRASARALLARLFTVPAWPLWLVENDVRALFRSPVIRGLLASLDPQDFLSPQELARIAIPCLVLWGTEEKLLPVELVEYYRQHLPAHGALEVVKGWPHASQMEQPDQVVERIVAFAQAVRGQAPTAAAEQ